MFADIVVGQELPAGTICPKHPGSAFSPESSVEPERRVIVGVIDEGLAFGHERFRAADGSSRVEFAWLQDAPCAYSTDAVGYGRELSKRGFTDDAGRKILGIDALLRRHSKRGPLDESAFYRDAGLIDFGRREHKAAARRVAHGTHVMDLACGYPPKENRVDRPIICVQLPTATVADTSGIGLEKFMYDALLYICARADDLSNGGTSGDKKLPLVINFSSGMRGGPHDGGSAIESAIDRLVQQRCFHDRPTAVVLPAGNSNLVRGHAQFDLAPGREQSLAWRVQPDDHTSSYLEIWLPAGATEEDLKHLTVSVTPPGAHRRSDALSARCHRHAMAWVAEKRNTVCKLYYEDRLLQSVPPATNGHLPLPIEFKRGRFVVALLPTAFLDAPGPLAPAGEWTITIRNAGARKICGIHAWIHWDERPIGYPRLGRQSYFDDPAYRRFDRPGGHESEVDPVLPDKQDSYVRHATTLNAIATGNFTVTVGGYRRKDKKPAKYSSLGPAVSVPAPVVPTRPGPDATAVTDESQVHSGILAAGSRDGSSVILDGTSVAAPQVARMIADEFAKGCRDDARTIVRERALRDESSQTFGSGLPPVPQERRGHGRLLLPPHIDSASQRQREAVPDLTDAKPGAKRERSLA